MTSRGHHALGRQLVFAAGIGLAVAVWLSYTVSGGDPADAACYFSIDPARPYATECWLYAPPFVLPVAVAQATMPFEMFAALLRAAETAALIAVTGPLAGPLAFIPQVATELNAANINLTLLLAILVGFRFPWTWSFVLLSKVTPGVGLLWFVVRREWRHLAIALGATAAIAAVSLAVAPSLWLDYVAKLPSTPDNTGWPVGLRLPFAAALVVWGARTNRRWTMPIALFLSLPRLYFLSPVVLVGLVAFIPWPRLADGARAASRRLGRYPAATSGSTEIRAPSS